MSQVIGNDLAFRDVVARRRATPLRPVVAANLQSGDVLQASLVGSNAESSAVRPTAADKHSSTAATRDDAGQDE